MSAIRYKIVVIDHCEVSRIRLCTLLVKEGYSVFECRDAYKALRLIRQIVPDLVLLDSNTKRINPKQLINIIRSDKLSEVIMMTNKTNSQVNDFLSIIHNTLQLIHQEKKRQKQSERKMNNLPEAIVIDQAKALLMKKWHINEEEAYTFIRKESMNRSQTIIATARHIISKEK